MNRYLIGSIFIGAFSLIIAKILKEVGKNKDEMGIFIFEKALSKAMLQVIGVLILGVCTEIIGQIFMIDFLNTTTTSWSLLVVTLGLITLNIFSEKRKIRH